MKWLLLQRRRPQSSRKGTAWGTVACCPRQATVLPSKSQDGVSAERRRRRGNQDEGEGNARRPGIGTRRQWAARCAACVRERITVLVCPAAVFARRSAWRLDGPPLRRVAPLFGPSDAARYCTNLPRLSACCVRPAVPALAVSEGGAMPGWLHVLHAREKVERVLGGGCGGCVHTRAGCGRPRGRESVWHGLLQCSSRRAGGRPRELTRSGVRQPWHRSLRFC